MREVLFVIAARETPGDSLSFRTKRLEVDLPVEFFTESRSLWMDSAVGHRRVGEVAYAVPSDTLVIKIEPVYQADLDIGSAGWNAPSDEESNLVGLVTNRRMT